MTEQTDCRRIRSLATEFALGVLPGEERAAVLDHLDACVCCQSAVGQLTDIRDRLLELVPEAEPPVGFEQRVLAGLPRPPPRRPRWIPLAAAATAVLLALGGFAAGRLTAPPSAVPGATEHDGASEVGTAPLMADGHQVGDVVAYSGTRPFIWVTFDTGVDDQSGSVACTLRTANGSWIPLGMFQMDSGHGSWGTATQLDTGSLRSAQILLSDDTGQTIATARFA
ncbi:zf-HC2 domain-containing protein [Pseudonocardia hispaniensis]|uniref:Zf-HC2 domain-containing protein n=1 Tax=Pseudonocardia hispaniensis TaxID=904933 RepID=A0ABW1IY64_9PSEU